jgi:hypothetical protein
MMVVPPLAVRVVTTAFPYLVAAVLVNRDMRIGDILVRGKSHDQSFTAI